MLKMGKTMPFQIELNAKEIGYKGIRKNNLYPYTLYPFTIGIYTNSS